MPWLILLLFLYSLESPATLPMPAELLSEYLQIDTTNPPGQEMKAARFLEKVFKRYDIPVKVFDLGHGRANLMASIPGDGSLRPLILLHHMDVVPADRAFWKHDPFKGIIQDGQIYGRGAIDIKGKGIMDLMVMLKLKQEKLKLKREIIYLAVADEETTSLGSKWMIEHHKETLNKAQYLIDEGSTVRSNELGQTTQFFVSLGEKAPLWLTLTFTGKTGHASVPHDNNPVVKAIHAAEKLIALAKREPYQVIPGTQMYLELNVKGDYRKFPGFKKDFKTSLSSKIFLEELAKVPELNALMRNTLTITGLKGSDKTNTIPNEAQVRLDCRLLPGTSPSEFLKKIKLAIGEDVKISVDESYTALMTPVSSPFLTALRKIAGDVPVVPTVLTASTDSSMYRTLGIQVFGFEAYPLTAELYDTAHGNDERMPIQSLESGINTLYALIQELNK